MTCPICQSQQKTQTVCKVCLVASESHDLAACPDCGVMYFRPLPKNSELNQFYSASYYDFNPWHDAGKGEVFARRLSKWKSKGRFLDVGCAKGYFIKGIKDHSHWHVRGVEFGKEAVAFARDKLGLDVHQGNLWEASFPDKHFDYIHMNNVLEHVLDPISLLNECRRIIKPGGNLFVSVPNGITDVKPLIRFFQEEKRPARSHNGHVYFFPRDSLLRIFQGTGFEVIKKKSGGFKRGLRNLNILPQKKTWKQDYFQRNTGSSQKASPIPPAQEKKYPDWYYRYRFIQNDAMNVSGLSIGALDFMFVLRPVK
jgi:2-polyprenyl-3-methyl-5-hydroxy-6-metoxy-1,4-benzoquinol methylase